HWLLKKGAFAGDVLWIMEWTGADAASLEATTASLDQAGLVSMDLSFLTFITFIAVIAAMVQLVEMVIDRFSPTLYNALGIFLPLIAVNCAILGASLFMVERDYTLIETGVFGVGSGAGWAMAIVVMAAIRQKLKYSHIPKGLRGLGITMLMTGLMAIAFLAFGGIQL
ncbi:MAG: Na+-transporting NADH:ubiquinone oxidoreductase subunit E, partial [Kiritimatiellia bacterium]